MATNTNAKAKAKATNYALAALPTNSVQYRQASGGTGTAAATNYAQAVRLLYGWAGTNKATPAYQHVAALVHLGWCAGNGARATVRKANSAACANSGNVLAFGQPAGPQVCNVLAWLAAAGAPNAVLATVWATYTGKA